MFLTNEESVALELLGKEMGAYLKKPVAENELLDVIQSQLSRWSDRMSETLLNDNSRCCVFRSGENWFGIGALAIHGIVPRPEIAELPHADASLKGVCHIQNEFIPVLSLRALSSIQYETSADAEQQLAILLNPQGNVGLVDRRSNDACRAGNLDFKLFERQRSMVTSRYWICFVERSGPADS